MKKTFRVVAGVLCFLLVAVNAWTLDFSKLSNQEMFELRHEAKGFSPEDREAYEHEWINRLNAMSDEERDPYLKQEKEERKEEIEKDKPIIQGRGYEKNAGNVIFGGK